MGVRVMTEPVAGAQGTDDAALLSRVRAGDSAAFGPLYQRHQQAARRLARELVRTPAEVDDAVAQAFARVLDVTLHGGGPTDAFRPYLLATLRRVCHDQLRQRSQLPTPEGDLSDQAEPTADPLVTELDRSLIVGAFLSLPERWRAVLWHTEIEAESSAEVTALLGLSRRAVTALKDRALEGLRQAYLQKHIMRVKRQACVPVAERLGAFVRDALSRRDVAMVTDHLAGCADCRAACTDLADIHAALRGVVAPIFLGDAAASYLSGSGYASAAAAGTRAAGAAGAGTAAGPDAAAVADRHAGAVAGLTAAGAASTPAGALAYPADTAPLGDSTRLSLPGHVRHAPRRQRWLLAGAAVVVVGGGIGAWAVTRGASTPPSSGHHHALAAGAKNALVQPTPSPSSPKPTVKPSPHRSSSPSAKASHSASPHTVSTPATKPAPAVKLAASISVTGTWHSGNQVTFSVTDTGKAGTGSLTASITLPPGAFLMHGGNADGGWTCQSDSSGATCKHAGISAGHQAQGTIFIGVGMQSCGQPVEVKAASGKASASAKSPQDIQCHGHDN